MPVIDLGSVVGPQGKQGATGPQGKQGIQGPAGTPATINGLPAVAITAGHNVELKQEGSSLEIGAVVPGQNLLDNWYLADPVNQRGKTTYDYMTGIGYWIDRCILYHQRATLESDGILIEDENSSDANVFTGALFVPNLTAEMQGKLYTFSVLIKDNTGKISVNFGRGITSKYFNKLKSVTQEAHEGTALISVTYLVNNPDPYTQCGVWTEGSSSVKVLAMKLELGSQQTLAHQNADGSWVFNDQPNKAMELLRCQRYQRVFNGNKAENGFNTYLAAGLSNTETGTPGAVNFPIILDPPMRANPSVTTNDISKVVLFPGNKAINSLSVFGPSPSEDGVTALTIQCNIAGLNYPADKSYVLNLRPGGQIILDANL